MDNRVGDRLPSEGTIDKIVNAITFARSTLAPYGCELTAEERKHTIHFRSGGEAIVQTVADLATARNVVVPNFPVRDVLRDLELVKRLRGAAREAENLAQLVSDTILEARSECWWATLAYYSILSDMSRSDPVLAKELEDVVAFFATGRRGRSSSSEEPKPGTPPQ